MEATNSYQKHPIRNIRSHSGILRRVVKELPAVIRKNGFLVYREEKNENAIRELILLGIAALTSMAEELDIEL